MHNLEIFWIIATLSLIMIGSMASSSNVQVHPVYKITDKFYPVSSSCKSTAGLRALISGFIVSCLVYHFSCVSNYNYYHPHH